MPKHKKAGSEGGAKKAKAAAAAEAPQPLTRRQDRSAVVKSGLRAALHGIKGCELCGVQVPLKVAHVVPIAKQYTKAWRATCVKEDVGLLSRNDTINCLRLCGTCRDEFDRGRFSISAKDGKISYTGKDSKRCAEFKDKTVAWWGKSHYPPPLLLSSLTKIYKAIGYMQYPLEEDTEPSEAEEEEEEDTE